MCSGHNNVDYQYYRTAGSYYFSEFHISTVLIYSKTGYTANNLHKILGGHYY